MISECFNSLIIYVGALWINSNRGGNSFTCTGMKQIFVLVGISTISGHSHTTLYCNLSNVNLRTIPTMLQCCRCCLNSLCHVFLYFSIYCMTLEWIRVGIIKLFIWSRYRYRSWQLQHYGATSDGDGAGARPLGGAVPSVYPPGYSPAIATSPTPPGALRVPIHCTRCRCCPLQTLVHSVQQ